MEAFECALCGKRGTPTTMRWGCVLDEVPQPESEHTVAQGVLCADCAPPHSETVEGSGMENDEPAAADYRRLVQMHGDETWLLGPAIERYWDAVSEAYWKRRPLLLGGQRPILRGDWEGAETLTPADPRMEDPLLDAAYEAWFNDTLRWVMDPNDATQMILEYKGDTT